MKNNDQNDNTIKEKKQSNGNSLELACIKKANPKHSGEAQTRNFVF